MKLIDLLVQELPKRGGWPHNALSITQDDDGSLCVWGVNDPHYDGFSWKHRTRNGLVYYWHGIEDVPLSCDHRESIVTYWQYKAALAASKNPAWNGKGLPPVGVECEVSVDGGRSWCTYRAISEKNVARLIEISNLTEEFQNNNWIFRPLRTEAERKHEAVLESICAVLEMVAQDYKREDEAKLIYEAIAAGKIPGVKLED